MDTMQPPPMMTEDEEREQDPVTTSSSGYATGQANSNCTELPKSDTLDSVALSPEPEPEKQPSEDIIPLDDDYENPFQDAHLNHFSGGNEQSPSSISPESTFEPLVAPKQPTGTILDGMDNEAEEFIQIKVCNPHKIGEGISSFIAYKVVTKTNISFFKRRESSVIRRFSDFLGLHDKLSEKYLPNGRIIPPAPDKSVVGLTKVKMGKDGAPTQGEEHLPHSQQVPDEFLERRRAALERFLTRTAAHPSLKADPDFREFLEFYGELPRSSQTATLSGKNVMKIFNMVSDKMSSITIKMEETDTWFEEKSRAIEELDHQLRRLHTDTESLFEYRRALSGATGSLARAFQVLSNCEDNSELAGAFATLGGVQEKAEGIHAEQASADFFLLSELIKDYIGLVSAVKDVFQERVKAWQHWQNATSSLTRKREAKVKAELQQRPERVGQLRQEIADLERQQEMAQENFEKISRLIKTEVEMFEVNKVQDFKNNIISYLQSMIKAQESISEIWEQYLPEIQRVNVNGSKA